MPSPIIAVDIGNTRTKFGFFDESAGCAYSEHGKLPSPRRTFATSTASPAIDELRDWSAGLPKATWWIASVNRPGTARLATFLNDACIAFHLVAHTDLPIKAALERPDWVGIDRLAGAVAANRLRDPRRPAIVVGVGTAITVDLLSADGVFRGGAILPGIAMSAHALDEFTDLLPRSPADELAVEPPALGTSTLAAIQSGLYWGAVGAIRELAARLAATLGPQSQRPELFLTGGAAPSVAMQLDPAARHIDHLVLAGIALAAEANG
jgi:type III pantothenate kinase